MKSSQAKLILLFYLFLMVVPAHVLGECTCEPESEDRNKSQALKYKLAAIASILVAGAIGVCLPILGKSIPALRPERNIFFMIKAFAAGVILATGFIHVLPDAFEHLTSPCLSQTPWEFPFTGFVAMMSAIVTLMIDAFATSYFRKFHFGGKLTAAESGGDEEKDGEHSEHVHVHTHASHGHSHGSVNAENLASSELLRHRVISQGHMISLWTWETMMQRKQGRSSPTSKI
ncbi:hypothetical protein TIFTF001_001598 [Ficus carica]|uniref:Uncharacterized protein n=1 Tax=Ficus carica TaxID=3494 RepID=A0AA87Z7G7_FICCA|nr:hypothetical protein TIFTF001_001598 [Ficus carica]